MIQSLEKMKPIPSHVQDPIGLEILKFLSKGMSAVEIGEKVFLSSQAVTWRIRKMTDELKCKNKVHLIDTAIRTGII